MAWARFGDTSANHPTVLAVLEHDNADDRIVNELFGFVARCSTQSAAHLTDYVINRGTAIALAGSMARADELLNLAIWAGYMTEETGFVDGREQRLYRIIEDQEFIHLRLREEIEWERQRKRDSANPELVIPVRLRDGDGCRYCGCVVRWGDQKGKSGGTYDHRSPGKAAETPDDVVVACRSCNGGRKDNPHADRDYPLLPAPTRARFSVSTVQWLAGHDYVRRLGIEVPAPTEGLRPGDHAGDGYSRPAPKASGNGSNPGQTTQGNGSAAEREGDGTPGLPTTAAPGPSDRGDGTSGPMEREGDGAPGLPAAPGDGTSGQGGTDATESGTNPPPGVTDRAGIESDRPIPANPVQSPDYGIRISRDGSGRDGSGRAGTGRAGAGLTPTPPPPAPRSKKRTRPRRRR